jgi:hypothetical protein
MRKMVLLLFLVFTLSSLWSFDSGKKPLKAMTLSLAIPGGGQFYNEAYYKAVFVFALESYFIGRTIYHHDRLNHYRERVSETSGAEEEFYQSLRNKYYRRRQNDFWWLGTIIFLSVVDGFVDAHLYNFQQEKEKVHILFDKEMIGIGIDF